MVSFPYMINTADPTTTGGGEGGFGKNLTLFVVEKKEYGNGPAKYRLACAKRPLKSLYSRVYITPVPHASRAVLG